MFLRDFCIQRPVFAIVINLFLLLGGLMALQSLPVRYLPKFDIPLVLITTALPGAGADLMERSVTAPIERSVSDADGIDLISSTSSAGLSVVQVVFRGNVDPETAASQVRAKVNEAQLLLPQGVTAPVVQRMSLDSQPSLYISFTDPRRNALELTEIIDRVVKPQLALVPGVANLKVMGERQYALRVRLDRFQMAAEKLTIDDVIAALQAQNVDLPGGEIVGDERRVSVLANTTVRHPAQFRDIVVRTVGNDPVRLGDVADIEVTAKSSDTAVRINGVGAVAVGIQRQSDANPVDISHAVRALMPALQESLPNGVTAQVAYDDAVFIEASVEEVFVTIGITIALVTVVVVLFLGSLRSSFIALVAIPLSLGGGLAFLLVMGYSLNIFTLLAFVLVIGLVVDDAIVEVENIQRHVDAGMTPLRAGFKGSREIGFAVVAMTTTLAAVYAPIGLLPGMMGALFREFAFTLAMTVVFSGYVAMTLSPMMCSRLLRPHRANVLTRAVDGLFRVLSGRYRRALTFTLGHRWIVGVAVLAALVAGGLVMSKLRGELAPVEDQGYMLVLFSGPQDASPAYMAQRADAIEAVLKDVPEKQAVMSLVGLPTRYQGMVFMLLKPWEQRGRTAMEIQQALEPAIGDIPGARAVIIDPNPLGGGGQDPVQFVLTSTLDYPQMQEAVRPFLEELRRYPGVTGVTTDLQLSTPVDTVSIDRDRAADIGLQMRVVADAMGKLLGDQEVNRFNWQGTIYPVMLGLLEKGRFDPQVLQEVYVRNSAGQMVPVGSVASVVHGVGAATLNHFNQMHSITVGADVASGHALMQVAKDIEAIAARTLPSTVRTDWNGSVRQMGEANASVLLVFVLAFAFIYLVLAAQFESFRDPFIILSVAPLSIVGAGVALAWAGSSLNLYSAIGFITLIGLIAKHGILITEFTNQLRDEGRPLRDALVEAAVIRLRPILMTTAAMVLGAVPLALATGPGAASRQAIGWVIVGGMLFGTLLSLFVIPTVYTLLSRRQRRAVPAVPSDEDLREGGLREGAGGAVAVPAQ